ncbi:hypothetical protein ILUMI_07066 [Ignelater luminosus]|uniref:MOSC domain-containing protein n=1 Tax=Ignelater luminosus TaxID=2038154 RepID=A0A8K0GER6_IGNLU|nr:hypothetical protein ILUMI_07066 [Ignelater luminosus]
MSKFFNFNLPILAATAVGAVTILGMYLYRKSKRNSIPTEWKAVGKVKGLYMYPLKSGRRVELKTAHCTGYGIQLKAENGYPLKDRCLVVYKEGNKEFKTARTYPKMVLIEVTTVDPDTITINAPGMSTFNFNVSSLNNANKSDKISLWEDEKIFTTDCGDEAARWVSQYILDKPSGLRLGFHDGLPHHRRNIEGTHRQYFKFYPYLESSSTGLYSDLTSYLLINQSSVDELSTRIPASNITAHNFRPNILIEGEDLGPYDEDKWNWVKIGDVILQNVKACTRCILTTIDPETGIRATNNEPIKTLKTYRKVKDVAKINFEGDEPIMGIHLGLKCDGEIKAGDIVFVGKM